MKFKLVDKKPVKGDVVSFIFEPEKPIKWQPGQYMHYLLPHDNEDDRGHERWFTDSAAPSENHIMISTRINNERRSSFKNALNNLKLGQTIEADGPEGDFVINDLSRNYLLIAGGIGITPFRSILKEAYEKGQKIKATLLYANRNQDIPFKDELDKFARSNESLKIEYITQPDRITPELLKKWIDKIDNPYIYISGPEPMVKDFEKQVLQLGVDKQNVKIDDFPGYEAD
jgi:ferredoxin-NADP reductase